MFLFSCAYAYAYVAYVMLIAQVGTRLKGLAVHRLPTSRIENASALVFAALLLCHRDEIA